MGNNHIKASKIKAVMRTQEKGWFSWFTGSGTLDEDVIGEDRQQIEAFYHDQGYVTVKVGMPDIKISRGREDDIHLHTSRRGRPV